MQTLTYQNHNSSLYRTVRFESQAKTAQIDDHENLCSAVRCWANEMGGQLFVALTVADAWRDMGGKGIDINAEPLYWRTKFFRWLDNRNGSDEARANIATMRPAILSKMPDEIKRRFGFEAGPTSAELVASVVKECSEFQQVSILGAPVGEIVKEGREAIESIMNLIPRESWGQVLGGFVTMIPGIM